MTVGILFKATYSRENYGDLTKHFVWQLPNDIEADGDFIAQAWANIFIASGHLVDTLESSYDDSSIDLKSIRLIDNAVFVFEGEK